jgi:hypothetical protein
MSVCSYEHGLAIAKAAKSERNAQGRRYRRGVCEAAARAASFQTNTTAVVDAIEDELRKHELERR